MEREWPLLSPKTTTVITAAGATPSKKITKPNSLHAKPYECRMSSVLGKKNESRSFPLQSVTALLKQHPSLSMNRPSNPAAYCLLWVLEWRRVKEKGGNWNHERKGNLGADWCIRRRTKGKVKQKKMNKPSKPSLGLLD
jgi:hypothetical protein